MSGSTPRPWGRGGAVSGGTLPPWEAVPSDGEQGRRFHRIFAAAWSEHGSAVLLAETSQRPGFVGDDDDHANALLMAAAPKLAEALEGLVRDAPLKCAYCGLQSNLAVPRHSPNCPLLAARAALTKAGLDVES